MNRPTPPSGTRRSRRRRALLAVPALALAFVVAAPGVAQGSGWSDVAINGQRLTAEQLGFLERQLGTTIAPGAYLLDPASGCWANLSTGARGCPGGADVHSGYGSGTRSPDGTWSHWSDAAGAGVGGTADGCIYTTTGWSNC